MFKNEKRSLRGEGQVEERNVSENRSHGFLLAMG